MLIWIIGLLLLAIVCIHLTLMTVDYVRTIRGEAAQQRREALLFRTELASVRRRQALERSRNLSWSGWRKFEVARKEYEDAERSICSFYLRPHDSRPIPAYKPGQYLTLQVRVNGRARADVRCYSLSDAARDGEYRISVKKVCPGDDNPNVHPGVVSCYLHDHIEPGAIIDVKPPGGDFFLDPIEPGPVVLIGGGVGITPMLAMINTITQRSWPHDVWLFYGVRSPSEVVMRDHLRNLEKEHPNFHLRICASSPRPEHQQGVDYDQRSRITLDLLKNELKVNNYDFYICGPGPLMESMATGLPEWGVPAERIHTETFGPSAPPSRKPDPAAAGPTITFRRSNKTVPWDGGYASLWEFATANGIPISSGCRAGRCGECKIALVDGQVKYGIKPSFDCESGSCLTCCCTPGGALVIDA